jgi:hypothetical protein
MTEEQPKETVEYHVLSKIFFWVAMWVTLALCLAAYYALSWGPEFVTFREVAVDALFLTPIVGYIGGLGITVSRIQLNTIDLKVQVADLQSKFSKVRRPTGSAILN